MQLHLCFRVASTFAFGFGVGQSVQYTAFDTASASSLYTGGGAGFAAGQALSTGAGYWCSAGSHGPGQVVSWTGLLAARRQAVGVQLSWAYSPTETQILASSDGDNFVEAACWRPGLQTDASYVEHVMFDRLLSVRAVTVVMRGGRAWGYFALHSVTLLAEPGPSMLVSGLTAPGGEMCAVSRSGRMSLTSCIDAIAAGTGAEVFRLTGEGLLTSSAFSNECAVLADGDAFDGGDITMTSCRTARQAEDGRADFRASANGQLRLALGSYCLVVRKQVLAVQDCSIAGQSENAGDKFFLTAVPEFDRTFADAARTSAQLAVHTAGRLEGLLGQLDESLPVLASCMLGQHLAPHGEQAVIMAPASKSKHPSTSKSRACDQSSTAAGIRSMIGQLNVGGLADVIARARVTLAAVRRNF